MNEDRWVDKRIDKWIERQNERYKEIWIALLMGKNICDDR